MANWLARLNPFRRSPADPVAGQLAALESRLKQLTESTDVADRLIQPWERFLDGSRYLWPSGYPVDRKAGRNWPVIQTEVDLRQARAFCRLIGDTNPLVVAFLDHVTNFVVGTGFKWQVGLKGVKGNKDDQDPAAVACQQFLDEFRALNGWGDIQEVTVGDFKDEDDSPTTDLEAELWRSAMRDGEVFARLFAGGAETNGVPTVRRVNPECVTCPPGGDQQGDWSWGILTAPGDRQRRLKYHVTDPDKPETTGDLVDAVRMLHLRLNVDSDVKRGLPDFWPLQDEVQTVQTLWRNMSEAAAICAAIAYIRQHAEGVSKTQIGNLIGNTQSGTDVRTKNAWDNAPGPDRYQVFSRHESGTVLDITHGMQYLPPPIVAGAPGFIQVQQSILRLVGIRWGCPEYFSGDSSNANFASTLVAGGPFERACQRRQQIYKLFQGNLAHRALLMGVQSGRLTKEQVMRVAVAITAPSVAIANKAEDTQRRSTLYQAGVLSKRTWCAEEGLDPDIELAQRKQEDAESQAQQQPPPGPGADPGGGAGVPQPGPTPDQGGGELDLSGLADQLFSEGVVREALANLVKKGPVSEIYTEAVDRSHLVFDRVKHRWVNPNADAGGTAPAEPKQPFKLDPRYKVTSRQLASKAVEMGRANPARANDLAGQLVAGLKRRFASNVNDLVAHHGPGAESHPDIRLIKQKDAVGPHLEAVRKAYLAAVKSGKTDKLEAALGALIERTSGHLGAADYALRQAGKTGDVAAGGLAQRVRDAGSVGKAVAALGKEDDLHPDVMTALTARVRADGIDPEGVLSLAAKAPPGSPARAAVLAAIGDGGRAVPFDPAAAAVVVTPEFLADLDDDARADLEAALPALDRARTLMGGGVQVFQADGGTLDALGWLIGTPLPAASESDGFAAMYDASPQSEKVAVSEVPDHAKTDLGEVSPDWDASRVTRYKRIDRDHYIEYDPATTTGRPHRVVKAKDVPPLIGVPASVLESVSAAAVPLWFAVLAIEAADRPAAVPPELLAAVLQAHARGDEDAVAQLVELASDPALLAAVMDGPPDDTVSEAVDRSHLVFDRVKKRWVNPNKQPYVRKTAPGQSPAEQLVARKAAAEPARQAARAAWADAAADPSKVTPDQLAGLADHLHALTRDELREVARGLKKKVGGLKREVVDRLLAHVGAKPTGAGKAEEPKAAGPKGEPASDAEPINPAEYVAAHAVDWSAQSAFASVSRDSQLTAPTTPAVGSAVRLKKDGHTKTVVRVQYGPGRDESRDIGESIFDGLVKKVRAAGLDPAQAIPAALAAGHGTDANATARVDDYLAKAAPPRPPEPPSAATAGPPAGDAGDVGLPTADELAAAKAELAAAEKASQDQFRTGPNYGRSAMDVELGGWYPEPAEFLAGRQRHAAAVQAARAKLAGIQARMPKPAPATKPPPSPPRQYKPDELRPVRGNTFAVRDRLAKIPGAKWDKDRKVWMVPHKHYDDATRIVSGAPKRDPADLLKLSNAELAERGLIRTSGKNGPYVRRGSPEELRDYLP